MQQGAQVHGYNNVRCRTFRENITSIFRGNTILDHLVISSQSQFKILCGLLMFIIPIPYFRRKMHIAETPRGLRISLALLAVTGYAMTHKLMRSHAGNIFNGKSKLDVFQRRQVSTTDAVTNKSRDLIIEVFRRVEMFKHVNDIFREHTLSVCSINKSSLIKAHTLRVTIKGMNKCHKDVL
nr:MAG TPA: hypothetical protein [Caudoviricetes sp.]